MDNRISTYIKLGIGLYIGYTFAKTLDKATINFYKNFKERIERGY